MRAGVFGDALCVRASCLHVDIVHGYCCGFICVLSPVLVRDHLHLGVGEREGVQRLHTHAHISLLAVE